MKTCYYELLGVEHTATDLELKKAYRRKALELHPDKNPDDVEAATAKFSLVRAAFEVLSDSQERSWYDAHKSLILNDDPEESHPAGGELSIPSLTVDQIMQYFNSSMYSKVDDSLTGFYNIVERFFERIAAEEITHAKFQGLSGYDKFKDDANNVNVIDPDVLLFPRFGNSHSDYTNGVKKFYGTWQSFQSVKAFSWADEYRYSSAPDRKTRRLMEKENKLFRDSARKEFNEAVRSLVAFIKKRDPRIKKGIIKLEEERKQRVQELVKREQTKRLQKMATDTQFEAQDWQKLNSDELDELERLLEKEIESIPDSEFDELENSRDDVVYECVVCVKIFRKEKQFEAHEDTKKHKKNLRKLQWEMKKEGLILGIDNDSEEFYSAKSESDDGNDLHDDKDWQLLDKESAELRDVEERLEENKEMFIGTEERESRASNKIDEQDYIIDDIVDEDCQEHLHVLQSDVRIDTLSDSATSSLKKEMNNLEKDLSALNADSDIDNAWDTKKKKGKSRGKKKRK